MRNKEMTTNIGTINLADIDITEDCLEVFIPVIAVSENLKAIIAENVEKAKADLKAEFLDRKCKSWSDAGINMSFQSLHITVKEKSFHYELCFDFEDKEDECIFTGFNLEVDLSEHETELKKLIVKAVIDKFF